MDGYGQFCPVAMASEILTRRWTPLVVRELLCGSRRFNDIHRGVPRISRTLLSQRLSDLERTGILERSIVDDHPEYVLTPAGEELRPLILAMGHWGKRWVSGRYSAERLDVTLLMWDLQRRIRRERLPDRRVTVHFHFGDAPEPHRDFWLCLEADQVDLCVDDPGYGCDLEVATDVRTLTEIWLGDRRLGDALSGEELRIGGPSGLRRAFPGWLGLSVFALDAPALGARPSLLP